MITRVDESLALLCSRRMAGQAEVSGDFVENRATTAWNVGWELNHPFEIGDLIEQLHDDIVADVVEEGLILDVHLGEFRVNVSRDEDVPRACQLLLNVLLFGLDQLGAGSDTSSHIL